MTEATDNSDRAQWLEREVAGLGWEDAQAAMLFLPLAARLAAVGRPAALNQWLTAGDQKRSQSLVALPDRVAEGLWDLEHATGEDLALAIMSAQDFHCLAYLAAQLLPKDAQVLLKQWSEETDHVLLDDEAIAVLEQYKQSYAIPSRMMLPRLEVLSYPIEDVLAASLASRRRELELPWPVGEGQSPQGWADAAVVASIGRPRQEIALAADSGQPGQILQQVFEILNAKLDTEVGQVIVSRRLFEDWKVEFSICPPAGTFIEFLRLGQWAADKGTASPSGEERWTVDLSTLARFGPPGEWARVLWAPLVMTLSCGVRLTVSDATS